MSTTQKIVPYLWFAGDAADGAALYADALTGATATVTARYPTEDLADFQREFAGKELTIDIEVDGFRFTLINAGPGFRPNRAVSFMVNMDPVRFGGDEDRARVAFDTLWERLAEGGSVLMPVGEYPFSPRYGWVEDRFGVNWQLIRTDADGEPGPFLLPELMFGGDVQNRAREAMEFYTALFPDSHIANVVTYPEATGPAEAGAVMFADFTLAGRWFAAMDSAVEQRETFTEGNSLQVLCADQAEIDRLWAALSSVPEAEQCGWCKDRFGLSWQIVPADLGALLARPGAYQRMLAMKKLVIADF